MSRRDDGAMTRISEKTIGRLSLYRRVLSALAAEGRRQVPSHELATLARGTPAQVRRDLMEAVRCPGRRSQGYDVAELNKAIGDVLDSPRAEGVALIGVGNLGRAILAYLAGRRPKLKITAAFDNDLEKVNRIIKGTRCRPLDELPQTVLERDIHIAIIAVPAGAAQEVADLLVRAGIRGLLNFAPVRIQAPAGVFIEDIDITMALEKAAFFARLP